MENIPKPKKIKVKGPKKPKEVQPVQPTATGLPTIPEMPQEALKVPAKKGRPRKSKEESPLQQANKQAILRVNTFMKKYFELADEDDQGHEDNETKLIEALLDIYDPEKLEQATEAAFSKAIDQ